MNIQWTVFAAFLVDWLIRIWFLFHIPKKRKPSSAIAWLLLIFILPGLGVLLFLIIGSPKLSFRRRRKQEQIDELIAKATQHTTDDLDSLDPASRTRIESIVRLNRSLSKLPARTGNSFKILPDYDKAIDDIVAEVNKATDFVHLEYFILALDKTTQPLFDAFAAAVQRGVNVRVLFDGMGYRGYPRKNEMKKLLTEIGVDWHIMLPVKFSPKQYNRIDLRNHRKILVIDNRLAYIGSQNLIDRTYHRKDNIYYDELVAKMTGPIVRQCGAVFAGDWYAETNERLTKLTNPKLDVGSQKTGDVLAQLVPSGPGYETLNNSKLFVALIHKAQSKLVITSASLRGVDVTIINSEVIDQWMVGNAERSYYKELMLAGVKIYLHKPPVLLHSKHMTIDDDIAVIGSSNMDIRSFELDLECVVVAYDKSVVKDLEKVQKRDIENSKRVTLKVWERRPLKTKFLESIARLTSALQ